MLSKENNMMKIEIKNTKGQIIVIICMTMLISMVSGIHRSLISLLSNSAVGSSTNLYNYIQTSASLLLWLGLAFTIAPFGLAKGITDYYAGLLKNKKKVLQIASGFYLGGVGFVILLLLFPSPETSFIFLSIASGLIGAGEGLFFATSQILLTKYTSGGTRGRYLGFSEFSIYGGYTIGSFIAGLLTTNLNFTIPYSISLLFVFLTIVIINKMLTAHSLPKIAKLPLPLQNELKSEGEITKTLEPETVSREKNAFHPMKLLKNFRILVILIGSHFSKWGDALVFLVPVYFAYLFSLSSNPNIIIPDTVKIGLVLGVYTASWAIGMFATSYITELLGRRTPILSGLLLSGLGFILLSTLTKETQYLYTYTIITMFLAGLGTGLYYPLLPAVGLDIAKPKYQGQTLALFRTFRDFGYFTGTIGLILLVYVSGSSIISLKIVISFVGVLMIIIALFFLLTLRETRPIWPFYEEFKKQIILIDVVVKRSVNVFASDLSGQEIELKRAVAGAKLLEKKADKKKRQLYKEIILPMRKKDDINDFVDLVELTDKISNDASMAALKYSKLYTVLTHIPKPLLEALRNLANSLPPMMDELVESIILMNEKVNSAVKRQKILSDSEQRVDTLYDEFLQLLYQFEPFYPENEKFTIMMTLKETSELLEKTSDLILNVGDELSMIAWKHRL